MSETREAAHVFEAYGFDAYGAAAGGVLLMFIPVFLLHIVAGQMGLAPLVPPDIPDRPKELHPLVVVMMGAGYACGLVAASFVDTAAKQGVWRWPGLRPGQWLHPVIWVGGLGGAAGYCAGVALLAYNRVGIDAAIVHGIDRALENYFAWHDG